MEWFGLLSARKRRRLVDCCDEVGISLTHRYSSSHQATAVAELLKRYIEATGGSPPWADALAWSQAYPWPSLASSGEDYRLVARGEGQGSDDASWLDRIIGKMPSGGDIAIDSYLDVLEMALLDRYLSAHEIDSLLAVAASHGLDRQAIEVLHQDYLIAMARVALEDGLLHVATLLGLPAREVDDALVKAAGLPADTAKGSGFALRPGDAICFTGSMTVPRDVLEREATSMGLVVGGLTKRTKLLVAADPDSLSGKAKKARDYGVAIVSESGFRTLAH
jgi:DNA polymerase-3 subunit epsilon